VDFNQRDYNKNYIDLCNYHIKTNQMKISKIGLLQSMVFLIIHNLIIIYIIVYYNI